LTVFIEVEPAEPAIRKVKLDLLAQPALRTDAVALADDHPERAEVEARVRAIELPQARKIS
jgi:hypothetical protein